MAKGTIMVVEDEVDILELLRFNLAKEGYHVEYSANGKDGLKKIMTLQPNLVILDLMLPDLDGLEICREMKASPNTKHIPIIMLTAKGEEADIVTGLELGADDYITKPFSLRELIARIKAVLRRKTEEIKDDESTINIHGMTIHPGRHEVLIEGEPVEELTFTEFKLLHYLARRPGWAFTRNQIIDAVQGDDYPVTERSVDVQVVGLRKKLGDHGKYIETVRGIGYRFREK